MNDLATYNVKCTFVATWKARFEFKLLRLLEVLCWNIPQSWAPAYSLPSSPHAVPSYTDKGFVYMYRHSRLHTQALSTQLSDKQLPLGHLLGLGICIPTVSLLLGPREDGPERGLSKIFWGLRY